MEDMEAASDMESASLDDEFDRLNRISPFDDEDLDCKIKWFFDRIEQSVA
jgi:hypothetical protein